VFFNNIFENSTRNLQPKNWSANWSVAQGVSFNNWKVGWLIHGQWMNHPMLPQPLWQEANFRLQHATYTFHSHNSAKLCSLMYLCAMCSSQIDLYINLINILQKFLAIQAVMRYAFYPGKSIDWCMSLYNRIL